MELAFIAVLIGLFFLRKYIRRKKYLERVTQWYRVKKSNTVMTYNRVVDQVAQTSMVLALLLPHILYGVTMAGVKWFLPGVVGYVANRTVFADVVGFYIPFVKTVIVIHRWRSFDLGAKVADKDGSDDQVANINTNATKNTGGFMSMFRKKPAVGSDYHNSIKNKTKAKTIRTSLSDEQKQVTEEASQLLQYWIVHALISAMFQTCMLLPILSRILSSMNMKSQNISSLPWKQKKMSWLNRINPGAEFFQECKLFFFIWLRLLPTSFTGASDGSVDGKGGLSTGEVGVKNRVAALEHSRLKSRKSTKAPFSNRPVDIIYERLSPCVIALVSSSSHLLEHSGDDGGESKQSFVRRGVNMCKGFLDAMVWTKMISEKTKSQIISVLVECSDLLPAFVTLFMPSYFTSYGIIYVQLIVPSATSASSYNALKGVKTNTELVRIMAAAVRYLQYWVIQGIIAWILSAFSPVLAWVPLSTHMIWIVWAYTQLEGTTVYLYNVIEWDLVAFGLLKAHAHGQDPSMDVNDTVTMKVFNSIAKRVPSGLPSQDSSGGDGDGKEDNVGKNDAGDENSNQVQEHKGKDPHKVLATKGQTEKIKASKGEDSEEDSDYVRVAEAKANGGITNAK